VSFQPVVAGSGLVGWRFLQRTYDSQFKAFTASPQLDRDADYFAKKIASVKTAEELVKDRRLLSVALGAFGLQGDIDNRFFIKKILEDGTTSEDALARKLTDTRYKKLSEAFGFGPGESRSTASKAAMASIVDQYKTQAFEVSVGAQDDSMRIALYAQRELASLARTESSEKAKWFTLMGQPPLRSMFETALGLPTAFGQIDIDKQQQILSERTAALLGDSTVSQFSASDALDRLTTLYLARAQMAQNALGSSPGAIALSLLRGT
jgi:hypothetical protein